MRRQHAPDDQSADLGAEADGLKPRAAKDKGEEETWRRTNPEAKARAEATVAQFQGSLDKLEKEKAKAEAAGDARKVADAESRIATTKSLLEAAQRAATEFGG